MTDAQQRQVTLQIADDKGSESSGDSSCEQNTGDVFNNEDLDQGEGAPDGANGFLHQQDERCNQEAIELKQVDGGKSIGEEQVEGEEQVDAAETTDEESGNITDIIDLLDPQEEEGTDPSRREDLLLASIEKTKYHKVKEKLTAKAVMNFGDNPLLSAITFTGKLHDRADCKNEHERAGFTDLANRMEEFTLRFLDGLKYYGYLREMFYSNPHTDIILETAMKLKQKKFFEHPIIIDLMAEKWYGGPRYLKSSKLRWLFLNIWCLFDIVLFPLTFFASFIAGNILDYYADYFMAPYFIFLRDMLSYLTLLVLHLAVCLEPSQLPFSPLEWAILIFLLGRLFMEVQQLIDFAHTESGKERKRSEGQKMTREALTKYLRHRVPSTKDKSTTVKALINYFSDTWNIFDIIILITFLFVILPLRIYTWVESESVTKNRPLAVAGYLYGFNAMFLTIRAFGQLLETLRGIGVIQIALFHIIRDAFVVVVHFIAITLAFSSTLTKIFVTDAAIFREETHNHRSICDTEMGIKCWWEITKHLSWSLLDLSDGLDVFKSADSVSETLARMLFAAYLIMALILLINMLIALLSNTYQRVQDNAEKEWAFQKAITIQTYRGYHPVPVPFNIISLFFMSFFCFRRNRDLIDWKDFEEKWLNIVVKKLLDTYRLKYGDAFPPLYKLDKVLQNTESTESMVSQVLYRTFKNQQGRDEVLLPTGEKAWDTHRAIVVEDYLLTCLGYKYYSSDGENKGCGARYCTAFSPKFPHFEVMILETGVTKWLRLGVVFEDHETTLMPGMEDGTVGYHTDDRNIFEDSEGKETTGSGAARRGDVIRCTVLFGSEEEIDGKAKVPVVFSVNGSAIILKGDQESRRETKTYIDADKPLYPLIFFKHQNSVLAKMCAREDGGNQSVRLQKMESDLEEVKAKLDALLAKHER